MRNTSYQTLTALTLALALSACSKGPTKTETSVTGVAYVGATVSNVEDTVALYTQAAAVNDVQTLDISGVNAINDLMGRDDVAIASHMLRSVNAQVRYMQFDETSSAAQAYKAVPVNGPGIAHLCFQVNAKTGTYPRFLEHGATHVGAKEMQIVNPRNPVQYAYITDKDGLLVEVEHVDVEKLNLETPPENEYRIRHISLATPDIDRLTKFYASFLGEKKPRKIGRLGGFGSEAMDNVSGLPETKIKMAWVQTRNLEIEMIQYVSHPTDVPATPRPLDAIGYNMIVFDVTDFETAKTAFTKAGGTIISEPKPMDGGQIMFGRDPDLNLIGLQIPAEGSIVNSAQFKNNGT